MEEIIKGKFLKTIYKTTNYMVAVFKSEEGQITTTGPSFDYDFETEYRLTGEYVDHPKYGFQFNVLKTEKLLPTLEKEVILFLSSKSFKGIGKRAAQKIYDHFGDQVLQIIKDEPSRIFEVDLTSKQLDSLLEGFKQLSDPKQEIMFHLISNGFNSLEASKIFSRFELVTLEISKDNPFRFYNEVNSMPFEKVKNYARKIDFSDKENKYKESLIIYMITELNFNSGDTYVTYNRLNDVCLKNGIYDLDEIINRCLDKHYIVLEDDKVYLFNDYNDEIFIANYLNERSDELILDDIRIDTSINDLEKELSITYDINQKEAIRSFFKEDTSIVVGGPGTGKTTIVKSMVEIFKRNFPFNNLMVVAPTGRAAKRINEICEIETKTIHSLLRWNKETNTFVYDFDNPILYDALIIDEFSMVDSNLFACLLKASSRVKKICIIGDDNQLPSIRPGYVLHDLIESNNFSVKRLVSNYRQKNGNEIIDLCNDIINQNVDFNKYNNDVIFYDLKKNNVDLISLIDKDILDGYDLNDIQVLAPMYKGSWGIDTLNVLIQNTFNPKDVDKNEKQSGKYTYRECDKILQLKNRPSDDVYNGDIGLLKYIDLKEKALIVDYQGVDVFYNYDELQDISLAYAMSVHKAQGSEYPIVYFVATKSNIHMLNQNLIYTAVSRAKKKLVIISEENILQTSIYKQMNKRNTTLVKRITQ